MSELISPARSDSRGQVLLEIAEEEKRRFRAELFAHEEQGRGRRKQKDCRCRAHGASIRNRSDPFAERTVSDLIMILKERDKRSGRQALGGFTAAFAVPVLGDFTLVCESFDQTTAQLIERTFEIVRIIAVSLARDQHVQRVVDVVVPLGGVAFRPAARCTLKVTGLVAVVFEDEVDVAIRLDGVADRIGQFG